MSNFLEVDHIPLRTYNRCVYAFNLLEDAGRAPFDNYLKQFSYRDRLEMVTMTNLVKKHGTKRVINMITDGLTFSNDDYVPISEVDMPQIVVQKEGTLYDD
jgi:hypothetical protein